MRNSSFRVELFSLSLRRVWFRLTENGGASVTARVVGIQNQVWFFLGQFED